MTKVLITPPSFARTDDTPLQLLKQKGISYIRNESSIPYTKEQMIELVHDCEGIILGVDPCDRDVLAAAPNLKVVSRFGVGADNVDAKYCKDKGISFYRTIGVNADAVADSASTLMMAVSRKLIEIDSDVRAGEWYEAETFEIFEKTLGLIGLGNIGVKVAKRASGFNMKVLAYDMFRNEELAKSAGVTYVDTLEEIIKKSDIISIHVPITKETYHMIGTKEIAMMKPKAVIVNTARGGILDEEALADALETNRILGAGLDVFENEPLKADSRFFKLKNVILTPHFSADTFETTRKVSIAAAINLLKGLGLN
jgi:D-3-phosphoglycerate dehydrogenase